MSRAPLREFAWETYPDALQRAIVALVVGGVIIQQAALRLARWLGQTERNP